MMLAVYISPISVAETLKKIELESLPLFSCDTAVGL